MAFPTSPTNGQIYTVGNKSFQWDSTLGAWKRYHDYIDAFIQYKIDYNVLEVIGSGATTTASGLSSTITLTDASHGVLITTCHNALSITNGPLAIDLYRGATFIQRLHYKNNDQVEVNITNQYMDRPGNVGPHTYSTYIVTTNPAAGFTLSENMSPSSITLFELK